MVEPSNKTFYKYRNKITTLSSIYFEYYLNNFWFCIYQLTISILKGYYFDVYHRKAGCLVYWLWRGCCCKQANCEIPIYIVVSNQSLIVSVRVSFIKYVVKLQTLGRQLLVFLYLSWIVQTLSSYFDKWDWSCYKLLRPYREDFIPCMYYEGDVFALKFPFFHA